MESSNGEVLRAKSPGGRAQLAWRAEKGFDAGATPPGLSWWRQVHNLDSWTAGATNQPTGFCLNVPDEPDDLLGEESLSRAQASERFAMIPIGAYLRQPDGSYWELVLSADGQKGVLAEDRRYLAGPGLSTGCWIAPKPCWAIAPATWISPKSRACAPSAAGRREACAWTTAARSGSRRGDAGELVLTDAGISCARAGRDARGRGLHRRQRELPLALLPDAAIRRRNQRVAGRGRQFLRPVLLPHRGVLF